MAVRKYKMLNSASGDVISYSVESNSTLETRIYQAFGNIATIEAMIRNSTIFPRYRVHLLNPDESIKREIPPYDILSGGSYKENYQSGQRRSVSITLRNEDGKYTPSANSEFWIGRKFLLEIGTQTPSDPNTVLWFKKGVYVLGNMSPSQDSEKKTISYSLEDKFSIFEGAQGTIPDSYNIPVGTPIEEIIEDILLYNNGDGNPLDPRPMIYHSSFKGRVTQQTIAESSGQTWSSILLKLAEMLSAEIFYNTEGQLVVIPLIEVMQDGDKPVLFQYFKDQGDFQDSSLSLDVNEVVNRVIVIGANVNGGTVRAEAVNDDPRSPLCYQRIGYRTASPINDSGITSQVLAQERADYELRKQIILKTSLSNSVYFNPLLEVNNLITVTDDYYDFKQERFLLDSISFNMDYNGLMSISSININNLPFTTN